MGGFGLVWKKNEMIFRLVGYFKKQSLNCTSLMKAEAISLLTILNWVTLCISFVFSFWKFVGNICSHSLKKNKTHIRFFVNAEKKRNWLAFYLIIENGWVFSSSYFFLFFFSSFFWYFFFRSMLWLPSYFFVWLGWSSFFSGHLFFGVDNIFRVGCHLFYSFSDIIFSQLLCVWSEYISFFGHPSQFFQIFFFRSSFFSTRHYNASLQ